MPRKASAQNVKAVSQTVEVVPEPPPENLALSVLLFHAAMNQSMAMSKFADELGISPISLRQFMLGKTQRPREKTFDLMAKILDLPVDEVRRRASLPIERTVPFSEWLNSQIAGRLSRAKLSRETNISDGALRNYLTGQTLPDSEQAQRLSVALNVPSLELARLIVSNDVAQNGSGVVEPAVAVEHTEASEASEESTDEFVVAGEAGLDAGEEASADGKSAIVLSGSGSLNHDEERLIDLWRQLHPQARRATLIYIAGLLAER